MVAWVMEDKSYLLKSSLMKKRYMVGGAQKVVMWYFANRGSSSEGVNLSKSQTKIPASINHCPYSLPHMAFIQPVSDRVKCRPSGTTLCQYFAVIMCAMG